MRIPVLVLTLAVSLGIATSADAATYCVHKPTDTCTALYPGQTVVDKGADLQAALDAANATAALDAVLVGPGTYVPTSPSGFSTGTSFDVTITGAGVGKTVLSGGATAASAVLQMIGSSATGVSELTLQGTPSVTDEVLRLTGPMTGSTSGPVARDVAVTMTDQTSSLIPGVDLRSGASLISSSAVGGKASSDAGAVSNGQGSVTLTDDTLDGTIGVAGQDFTAQRLRITATRTAIAATLPASGSTSPSVNGVLAVTTGSGALAITDFANTLTVRSGTFIHTGSLASGAALSMLVNASGQTGALTMKDSIVRGYASTVSCGDQGSGGTASVTLGWDDIHLDHPGCAGPGMFDGGIGNIDSDPLFVNAAAGDYRLLFGSPAIDAGEDMCNGPCQGSDLAGVTRPVDGGSGQALRDMGAFEYGHRAPTVSATASAATVFTGTPVTFTATGADPDGDPLTYSWAFDDGPFAPGASVTHVLPFAGVRTATVTATDASGLSATAAAVVTVAAPLFPASPDRTAPTVSRLSLTHATFAVSSSSTATSAAVHKAKPKKKPATPKGTSIHFTLSEAAKVVVTLTHTSAGIKVPGKCVAPSAKHRHGTRCDLTAGTITRRSEKQGADAIAFSGRLGHRALAKGRYKLSIVATDAAGNRSKAHTLSFTIA